MAYSLSVHDCKAVRIERHMPANSNCVSLVIESAECDFSINLFDLPDHAVAALIAGFGPPQHVDATPPMDLISETAQANVMAALERATQPFVAAAHMLQSVTGNTRAAEAPTTAAAAVSAETSSHPKPCP